VATTPGLAAHGAIAAGSPANRTETRRPGPGSPTVSGWEARTLTGSTDITTGWGRRSFCFLASGSSNDSIVGGSGAIKGIAIAEDYCRNPPAPTPTPTDCWKPVEMLLHSNQDRSVVLIGRLSARRHLDRPHTVRAPSSLGEWRLGGARRRRPVLRLRGYDSCTGSAGSTSVFGGQIVHGRSAQRQQIDDCSAEPCTDAALYERRRFRPKPGGSAQPGSGVWRSHRQAFLRGFVQPDTSRSVTASAEQPSGLRRSPRSIARHRL